MGTHSAPFSAPSFYLTIFFSTVTRRRHRLCFCARSPLNAAVGSCCIRILDWGSERRTRRRGRFGVGEGGGEGGVLGYGGLRRPLRVQATRFARRGLINVCERLHPLYFRLSIFLTSLLLLLMRKRGWWVSRAGGTATPKTGEF